MPVNLFIQNEDESMIASAESWEGLEVVDNGVSGRNVISGNVANHPVKVFAVFFSQMAVEVRHRQSPQRVLRVRLGQLKTDLGRALSFFGFDDVPFKV